MTTFNVMGYNEINRTDSIYITNIDKEVFIKVYEKIDKELLNNNIQEIVKKLEIFVKNLLPLWINPGYYSNIKYDLNEVLSSVLENNLEVNKKHILSKISIKTKSKDAFNNKFKKIKNAIISYFILDNNFILSSILSLKDSRKKSILLGVFEEIKELIDNKDKISIDKIDFLMYFLFFSFMIFISIDSCDDSNYENLKLFLNKLIELNYENL